MKDVLTNLLPPPFRSTWFVPCGTLCSSHLRNIASSLLEVEQGINGSHDAREEWHQPLRASDPTSLPPFLCTQAGTEEVLQSPEAQNTSQPSKPQKEIKMIVWNFRAGKIRGPEARKTVLSNLLCNKRGV